MTARATGRLAWGLGGAGIAFVLVAAGFFVAGGHAHNVLYGNELAIAVGFSSVGAVVAARVPGNALGWLLLATGVVHASGLASIEWVSWLGPGRVHEVPVGFVIYAEMSWLPGVVTLFTLVPLLFPTGRPLPGRWRHLVWLTAVAFAVGVFGILTNTREWPDLHVLNPTYAPTLGKAGAPTFPLLLGTAIGCVASLIVRYRRARGTLRQQMRWFVWAATVGSAIVAVELVLNAHNALTVILQFVAVFGIPLSIGAAILRYRLYDIDRIVSRTVTYAAVTALVVAPYVVLVVAASRIGRGSSITVAALTLVALAAVRPAHRRLQRAIDRRFNRERYDAARTVEAFALRLRDEVDADLVRTDLLSVTARSIQPSTVSLWMVR